MQDFAKAILTPAVTVFVTVEIAKRRKQSLTISMRRTQGADSSY